MVRMLLLSRWEEPVLTSVLEAGRTPGPLGLGSPTLGVEPLLFRRPGRAGRSAGSRHAECRGEFLLKALEGEVAVSGLGACVLGDGGHLRPELSKDAVALDGGQGDRLGDVEDRLDP
jgi:hypothetical protein